MVLVLCIEFIQNKQQKLSQLQREKNSYNKRWRHYPCHRPISIGSPLVHFDLFRKKKEEILIKVIGDVQTLFS